MIYRRTPRITRRIRKALRNCMIAAMNSFSAKTDNEFKGDWKDIEDGIWSEFYLELDCNRSGLQKYAPRVDPYSCPRHAGEVRGKILRAKKL